MTRRPEAALERDVLLALGRYPQVLVMKNEVGVGYRGALVYALQDDLAPFGRTVVQAAIGACRRHRLTYGLGVGSPDLVGTVDGRAFGIELKSPDGGRVSEEQARWHAAARRRGVLVEVVRSVDEALGAVDRVREAGR